MASKIEEFLNKILSSRYGKDVRQAIHDGIEVCYNATKADVLEKATLNYKNLRNLFEQSGFYISNNLLDVYEVGTGDTSNIKYIVPRNTNKSAVAVIVDDGGSGISRNIILYSGYGTGNARSETIIPEFPCVFLNDDIGSCRVYFNTDNDVIENMGVYFVFRPFIDLDDDQYIITDEFVSSEATIVTPNWNSTYGNLMETGMIRVAPGDELTVETPNAQPFAFNVTYYYPGWRKNQDGVTNDFGYDSGSIIPNTKGLVIAEPCGGVRIYYGEKDTIKIYRKRKKKAKQHRIFDFLGDSITEGFLNSGSKTNDIAYPKYVEQLLVLKGIRNFGVSGTTVSPRDGYSNSFLERLPSIISSTTTINHFNLFILGGVNDYTTQIPVGNSDSPEVNVHSLNYPDVTFYKSYEAMLLSALEAYRGRVYCATPLKRVWENEDTCTYKFEEYVNAIVEICEKYSVPCLRLDIMSSLNPHIATVKSQYFSDNVHPNGYAHGAVLGPIVAKFLENYAFSVFAAWDDEI